MDIREHGIVLKDIITGERTTTKIETVEQLGRQDEYDLVMVPVRKNQVSSVLPALAANSHTPDVLFMTNNAAGPDEMTRALGRERVLLGFPGAGGKMEGYITRVYLAPGSRQPTTIGELNGQTTPRLTRIAEALLSAGFPVAISPNMDAWLKTHAALISPIANAFYMAGSDVHQLAHTRDALVTAIRAVREGFKVLRALHVPVTPPMLRVFEWIPEPLVIAFYGRAFDTERAEIALAAHANAARDEMAELSEEFQVLARASGLATPAIDRLHHYTDVSMPPLPGGSAAIPEHWSELWVGFGLLGVLVAILAGIAALLRRGSRNLAHRVANRARPAKPLGLAGR